MQDIGVSGETFDPTKTSNPVTLTVTGPMEKITALTDTERFTSVAVIKSETNMPIAHSRAKLVFELRCLNKVPHLTGLFIRQYH